MTQRGDQYQRGSFIEDSTLDVVVGINHDFGQRLLASCAGQATDTGRPSKRGPCDTKAGPGASSASDATGRRTDERLAPARHICLCFEI